VKSIHWFGWRGMLDSPFYWIKKEGRLKSPLPRHALTPHHYCLLLHTAQSVVTIDIPVHNRVHIVATANPEL
jgi:hypothetical protein